MSESNRKPVSLAVGAALIGGLGLCAPTFAMDDLAQGYLVSAQETGEAAQAAEAEASADKAAEGNCGADAEKAAEGSCGGHADAAAEADDAATDTGDKAEAEGKCGEGKCGGAA
ncbi:hypothetical protein QFW77_00735 [Luteimonas sp. RD2P54]|uniref:Low-complexity protein n=1 Tax=Luteimonas endophytica TaxID=3042023 RepID=A0ABT6J3W8_9GAMM|nr:hypothetical protein [Luteimonas endophytica]MDH5821521.1 hypothetical protein [Luteimonas endophytica]